MKKFITRVRSALSGLLVPSISIALTLIVASVIVLLLGKNPLEVFLGFLRGSGLVFKPRYAGGQGILTDFFSLRIFLSLPSFGHRSFSVGDPLEPSFLPSFFPLPTPSFLHLRIFSLRIFLSLPLRIFSLRIFLSLPSDLTG